LGVARPAEVEDVLLVDEAVFDGEGDGLRADDVRGRTAREAVEDLLFGRLRAVVEVRVDRQ
jgi:hypothetical protein